MGRVFKSEAGREAVLEHYSEILNTITVDCSRKHVDTEYGRTAYIEAGEDNEEVVLLLHGSCSNSVMWVGDIPVLSEKYRVIALDIIGEAGASEECRLKLDSAEYARWLKSFLDALSIESVIVVGNSFGGWLGIKLGTIYPEKVKSLVLIASSGIVSTPVIFVIKCIAYLMLGRYGRVLINRMVFGKKDIPREVQEYTDLILDNFKPMVGKIPEFSDKELSELRMPVLFIAGEKDVTMNVAKAAGRLAGLENVKTLILKDEHHVITGVTDIIIKNIG